MKSYLTSWVNWLVKNDVRPSDKRVKEYLNILKSNRPLTKDIYATMGQDIKDFTKYNAEKWEKANLVKTVVGKKEKLTIAMPADMLEAVSQ